MSTKSRRTRRREVILYGVAVVLAVASRVDWVIINRIAPAPSDANLPAIEIFEHKQPSGRVDIERNGNTFEAKSRGVREFALLLSPDVIDFSQPVTVTVNGQQAFQGAVKRDPAVLLKWSARDVDRLRLYGAELKVTVP